MKDIELVIRSLLSDDDDTWREAQKSLAGIAGSEAVAALVELLGQRDARQRNRAAVTLRLIGADSAVKPLFDAIKDPRNVGNVGTLVYALQTHDCSKYFTSLFLLMLRGNYEVRSMGLPILNQQKFDISDDDLSRMKEELARYRLQTGLCDEDRCLIVHLTGVLDRVEHERV